MKKLVICEKPSLAMNVASALKIFNRKDGYVEGEETIVTFAFRHLFGLKDVKDYLGVEKLKWSEVKLPFIPNPFEFKLKDDDGIIKQFNIIKELIGRDDVSEIVNCGDADREGQLIIDLILKEIGTTKPIKRLWLPEQTEETIRNQYKNIDSNENYENLHNEGLARTYMDWLLGINTTIYLTVKSGVFLRSGRVLIPIVKYIYDRDMTIKNFKIEDYYQPESVTKKDDIPIKLKVKEKYTEEAKAKEYSDFLNQHRAVITNIESKEVTKSPGKLFSLSKLQSLLSKNEKMDFKSSLKIIQELYEKGYITYPRTNTEYLAENEKDKVKNILKLLLDHKVEFKDKKRIFDDSKIESHSAITITTKIPNIEKDLNDKEKIVYKAVFNRFISNFLIEDTILAETNVEIKVATEIFNLKGSTVVQEGFYKYEPPKKDKENEDDDITLPVLIKGEEFGVNFIPIKKKTTPPKKVTEAALASYLKNPFKTDKTTEDEEYKAMKEGVEIGTEATRTGIVENAKNIGYISQKGSNYSIEELGIQFIELLVKLNINLFREKTVEFSKKLKEVFNNNSTLEEAIKITIDELENITSQDIEIEKINKESLKEPLGNCPMCKSPIYEYKTKENKSFFPCSNKECKFKLFETTKIFGTEVKMTSAKVKTLISGKNTKFKLFSKTKNKEYEALIALDGMNGDFANFKIVGFPDKKKK